jgi:hypothetical protein
MQLNIYRFEKLPRSLRVEHSFRNSNFMCGRPDLLPRIVRVVTNGDKSQSLKRKSEKVEQRNRFLREENHKLKETLDGLNEVTKKLRLLDCFLTNSVSTGSMNSQVVAAAEPVLPHHHYHHHHNASSAATTTMESHNIDLDLIALDHDILGNTETLLMEDFLLCE